jgi:maleylacetate reductase
MLEFVYEVMPSRVVFGAGALARVPEEVERLGIGRAMIVTGGSQRRAAEELVSRLGERAAGITDRVKQHVPLEIAEAGREEARRLGADGLVAIGGGTPIGLAKAITLELGLPILVVPTTFAGSEMTQVVGITEGGVKRTRKDSRILPKTVVYDPELLLPLPPRVAGPSGMNAMAHAVEALWSEQANPLSDAIAEEAIRALARSLPRIAEAPDDLEARSGALLGAWLASACLGSTGMAIHHKLAHVLGGSFDLPHADTHTVLLPYTTAYNRDAAPEAMRRIARALDHHEAATGIAALIRTIAAPAALSELGLTESVLDRATEIALETPFYNPASVTRDGVRALLDDAFHGRPPVLA